MMRRFSFRRALFAGSLTVLLTLLTGCSDVRNTIPREAVGEWILTSVVSKDSKTSTLFETIDPVITLSISGRSLEGNAGCNTYAGEDGSGSLRLPLTKIIATRVACKGASVMPRESTYLDILTQVDAAALSNTELVLRAADAELRFQRMPPMNG